MERKKLNVRPLSRRNTVLTPRNRPKLRRSNSLSDIRLCSSVRNDISRIPSTSTQNYTIEAEKENVGESLPVNNPLMDLKCLMLQRSVLFKSQQQNIQELEKRMLALKESFRDAKADVESSLNVLQQLNLLQMINKAEKEKERLLSNPAAAAILQNFENLMEIINHERNKLELRNLTLSSKDEFERLLSEAQSSIEYFNKQHDLDSLHKFITHLGELEETIGKFNHSNKGSAELIEKIKRMILHNKVLKMLNETTSDLDGESSCDDRQADNCSSP